MRLRYIPTLAVAAAASAAIAAAPTAAAAPSWQTCTHVGLGTTQCQSPGNAQISTQHDVEYPSQFPFYGNILLFHHGGHRG